MKNLQFMNLFTGLLKNSLFGALFSTVNLSKKIPNDQNFYLPDVFFYQFDSDVISYSSNDNRFEPENKKAHINQNVQVQDWGS